jgi:hypothetical protein
MFWFCDALSDFDVKEFRLTPKKRGENDHAPRNLWFY